MEREKMIEEIARKVCIACGKCKELKADCYLARNIASIMIDDGYRKVPDGAVVLTKEEYERLKKEELYAQGKYNLCHGNRSLEAIAKTTEQTGQMLIDYDRRIRKAYDEIIPKLLEEYKQVRKETAREILKKLNGFRFVMYDEGCELASWTCDEDDVKQFAKQFGVEVGE